MSSEIIKHTAQQDCERVSSQSFNTLLADVRQIIENGRKQAYNAVEQVGIATNVFIDAISDSPICIDCIVKFIRKQNN